jgi:hypothetical protein
MIDTTVYIGGIALHEPVAVSTDYMTTLMCFYFYTQLKKQRKDSVINNWSIFFLLFGLSTFLGGTSHGFFAVHEGVGYKTFWLSMQIVNGIAIYFAQKATLDSVLKNSQQKDKWKASYPIQLIVFFIVLMLFQKYLVTIIENAVGLIPIMILHLKSKDQFQKKIGYGIVISFIPAIVFLTKFTIHPYFNHIDLAHVFIMVSISFMYLGVKRKAIS